MKSWGLVGGEEADLVSAIQEYGMACDWSLNEIQEEVDGLK